ncbi:MULTISPECIES: lactococcin 972 family bacteriocin [unclassified Corynebacterium]|uniref:lactococcin 972 family bacteriocin n=1 Tax=unclassified Corynebacterium TaxID=2624378 RepID=UPI0029C9B47E|nr:MULTISPECIES: lactococcin 972 family bacteriocin [unclassified Corynebacterium]WPF66930.1 lactococcin 972 family bacteriocin [Corynebacterium sp. 22KM0430]WPF69418.1 lactococcin 972 family bacteriocin [Corynebacterium sp. 21KM1197]
MVKKKIAGTMISIGLVFGILVPVVHAEELVSDSVAETDYAGYDSGVLKEVRENSNSRPFRFLSVGKKIAHPYGGGRWEYGFWQDRVRSYFNHSSRCHGSTVVLNGHKVRSIDTAPGKFSDASKWAYNLPNSRDEYYYRFC